MKFETIAIHGGYSPEPTTNAVAVPIYQTTSYSFRDTQHGADLFDLKEAGNIYTRIMNPTSDVLENRVAAMEGGVGALALASGSAATTYAIMTICEAGDNVVSTGTLYGGTYTLFAHQLPRFGVDIKFGDHDKIDELEKLIDSKTKAVFCESIGNPAGNVVDIPKMAKMAHKYNIPLIVDNTVPSPYLFRPIEHGADIIVHSLTKYMGGHGTSIGGIIVDSGKFPWAKHKKKFSRLTTPDMSYHGVVFSEALGDAAFIGAARCVALRNMGAAISPFNSFLILQGIESLAVRMDRHCENAVKVSNYLLKNQNVTWVKYAGMPSSPDYQLVKKLMNGKASSVLSFGIEGGRVNGSKFIDNLGLITRLVNIGDAKSLACHPASTTHRQLGPDELKKAGVPEDLVRLSIGIENVDDIIEDIDQALSSIFGKSKKKE
ncbi:MAG: O-acetylhomoserine aminocarboxypropyltransferase [Gammaproteobacteria bacterium]|nr:O-acetylhomoserine aminocarboxypropyltransferase [Gammaproteobacteria bacterium]|tara:strand:- start:5999 stop:7294 length:1296 start_codon:yes stop_codon:yes gene_type:complete